MGGGPGEPGRRFCVLVGGDCGHVKKGRGKNAWEQHQAMQWGRYGGLTVDA